jgi:hypothetical protein
VISKVLEDGMIGDFPCRWQALSGEMRGQWGGIEFDAAAGQEFFGDLPSGGDALEALEVRGRSNASQTVYVRQNSLSALLFANENLKHSCSFSLPVRLLYSPPKTLSLSLTHTPTLTNTHLVLEMFLEWQVFG